MKIKDILPTEKLYVVTYSVRRTRLTGSYLVNADSAQEAAAIVKRLNPEEYFGIKPMSIKKAAEEYSMDEDDLLSRVRKPKKGKATHIESGT